MEKNPDTFKALILSKNPNAVASDGRRYADIPAVELTQKVVAKHPNGITNDGIKYSDFLTVQKPTRQQTSFEKSNIRAQTQADIAQSNIESQKANSVGGFIGNFGKALVSNLAPSEVGLGETLRKTFLGQGDTYSKLIQDTSNSQIALAQLIAKNKKAGKDTSKLEGLYAEGQKQLSDLQGSLAQETNLPTTGQAVGQLGGTALDLLTAGQYGKSTLGMKTGALAPKVSTAKLLGTAVSPELTKIAGTQTGGLFTGQGVKNVLGNTGIGYASDVTSGLAGLRGEDRTGGKAFIPGAGTLLTGGISTVGELGKSIQNVRDPAYKASKLVEKRTKELNKLDNYVALKKQTEKGLQRGIDIKKVLAETDVLHGSVDKNGTINTLGKGGAVDQYRTQYVDGNEAIVSQALKKENRSVAPQLVKAELRRAILNSGLEGSSLIKAEKAINNEIAGYARRAGPNGTIPLSTLHDAKVDKYSNINFLGDPAKQKYDKVVANTLKNIIEKNSKSIDVQNVNKELSKHFAVIDYLEKLNNKKVEGGRLGKYFASTVGAIVGSQFGPVGGVVGAELGGRVKGNLMSRAFKGKTGIQPTQAEAITQAKTFLGEKPLQIGQSSNMAGSLNANQANTIAPTNIGISKTVPEQTYLGQGITEGKQILENLKGKQLGMSIKAIKIPEGDKKSLVKLIDDIRLNKKTIFSGPEEALLRDYGVDPNKAPASIANRLENMISRAKTPLSNYTKGEGGKFTGSKALGGLEQEAKKYKSAEEFVKAQKTGDIPSGTYDSTVKSLSESSLLSKENNPVVVGKIGKYEIRESGRMNRYAKVDKNGEIVRSADSKALYLTPEEIKAKGLAEKDSTLVVFDGDKPVGYVMDSFGSPEISVAKEYQRQGIGSELLKRWMQKFPNKKIGQMTPEGEALVKSQLTDIWNKANKK